MASLHGASENKAQRTPTPPALRASLLLDHYGCWQGGESASRASFPSGALSTTAPSLSALGSWEKRSETSHLHGAASSLGDIYGDLNRGRNESGWCLSPGRSI